MIGNSNSLLVKNMVLNKMSKTLLNENETVLFTCLYKYIGNDIGEYGKSEVTTLDISYYFETDKKRKISFKYVMEEKTLYHTTNYDDFPEYSKEEMQNIADDFIKNIFVDGWARSNRSSRFSKENYGEVAYNNFNNQQ